MAAELQHWIVAVDANWALVKSAVEHVAGHDDDWIHVVAGPLIQLVAALVMRQSVQRIWPWLVVLALELFNEWHDLVWDTWPNRQMQFGEGLKDILLTMALPTILLLASRHFPHWFGMNPPRRRRGRMRKR